MQQSDRNKAGYLIGGLTIEVNYPSQLRLSSKLKGFSAFRVNNYHANLEIDFNIGDFVPDSTLTQESFCRVTHAKDGDGYQIRIRNREWPQGELRANLQPEARKVNLFIAQEVSASTISFAVWLVYALFSMDSSIVPIHSSAVIHNGRAVLFLGESGAGKSTQTTLWTRHIEGSTMLNDDSPIVTIDRDGSVWAHGSPWSGKGMVFKSESYPVAAFVRVEQSRFNRVQRVNVAEALAALLPSFPPQLTSHDHYYEKALECISAMIKAVPVFKLECRPFADAAILTHTAIFKSNNSQ